MSWNGNIPCLVNGSTLKDDGSTNGYSPSQDSETDCPQDVVQRSLRKDSSVEKDDGALCQTKGNHI